jgi:hypothetical protein
MARTLSDRKAQEWQQRFLRFETSRLTINEFCRQEGFSPQSFFLWRKRLVKAGGWKPSVAEPPAGFRPVRLLAASGVDVRLPGGTQLVVPTSDADSLRLVIETLARVDADRAGGVTPC